MNQEDKTFVKIFLEEHSSVKSKHIWEDDCGGVQAGNEWVGLSLKYIHKTQIDKKKIEEAIDKVVYNCCKIRAENIHCRVVGEKIKKELGLKK